MCLTYNAFMMLTATLINRLFRLYVATFDLAVATMVWPGCWPNGPLPTLPLRRKVLGRAEYCDRMHPLDAVNWPVLTERLSIRRATHDDDETTWRWRQLPEVGEWITRAPTDYETYRVQFMDPVRLATTLVIELDGEPIGDLMVKVEDAWTQAEVADLGRGVQAELGWTLDPAFHGKGFATEAVRAAIGLCFAQLGLRRVHAGCFAANESSWRVMERLGMRREEVSRKSGLHRSGEWMDGMDYGLLAEEWNG